MLPESVKDRSLTYPADVWALGCVAVEMMAAEISAWGSFDVGLLQEMIFQSSFLQSRSAGASK